MIVIFRKRGVILTFIRLFINSIIFFTIMNTASVIFQLINSTYLNKGYYVNYYMINVKYILALSFVFSIMFLGSSKYVTKVVRIDEKSIDENRIKTAMKHMKWVKKNKSYDSMTYTSPLGLGILKEEICIRFDETEIYITGPYRYVENFIRAADFPYASFEVISMEKEAGYK